MMNNGRHIDPYAQEPQYAAPQQHANPPQYAAPPPPQPAGPQSKKGQKVVLAVFALVIGFVAFAVYYGSKSSPDFASVGDCVARGSGSSVTVVECTDSKSEYKVVGKVPGKTQVQFNINSSSICKPFPEAKTAYWRGESGGKGYVLCLAPVK
jgi:hypothetical protein